MSNRLGKQEFVKLFDDVEHRYQKAHVFADALNAVTAGDDSEAGYDFLEGIGFNWYLDYIIRLLAVMYNDTENAIEHFVYESDWGHGAPAEDESEIHDSLELYDFLTRER